MPDTELSRGRAKEHPEQKLILVYQRPLHVPAKHGVLRSGAKGAQRASAQLRVRKGAGMQLA